VRTPHKTTPGVIAPGVGNLNLGTRAPDEKVETGFSQIPARNKESV